MVQVLGVITDNAANMTCWVSKWKDDMEHEIIIDYEITDEELEEAVLPLTSGDVNAVHVRCAAHTLQLAIKDGIRNISGQLLQKVRIRQGLFSFETL